MSNCTTRKIPSLSLMLALIYMLAAHWPAAHFATACSSRTVPKPRPSSTSATSATASPAAKATTTTTTTTTTRSTTTSTTTVRPNITFPTYKCPETYDAWYCLNEATCFTVKIGDSVMYNCECAVGFMGPRCEYKELDGSLRPQRPRPMLEKASIASGATLALLFMLFVCLTLYLRHDQKSIKFLTTTDDDVVRSYNGGGGSGTGCRYCNEKCCNDEKSVTQNWWRRRRVAGFGFGTLGSGADADVVGFGKQQQQHLEAMPMTFALKRTTKM